MKAKNGVVPESQFDVKGDGQKQPLTVENMKEKDAYKNTYYNSDMKPNSKEYGSEQKIVEQQLKDAM
jgi:hypothetical protein